MTNQVADQTSLMVRGRRALWRAMLFLLFTLVLLIPRTGRLRRRIGLWRAVQGVAIVAGAWLVWRFDQPQGAARDLVLGVILLCFGLLVQAQREKKSVDARAGELEALVALNGGTYVPAGNGQPTRSARIFVHPDALIVLDDELRLVAEIPLAGLRHLAASGTDKQWELQVVWEDEKRTATASFRYEGFFAEHMARVAETTIRGRLQQELRVLQA